MKKGAGAWAILNDTFVAYTVQLGLLKDPMRPRSGCDEGKVESRVWDVIGGMVRKGERFVTLADLNQAAGERIRQGAKQLTNPVTGDTVNETWLAERGVLLGLPSRCRRPCRATAYAWANATSRFTSGG